MGRILVEKEIGILFLFPTSVIEARQEAFVGLFVVDLDAIDAPVKGLTAQIRDILEDVQGDG